MKIQFIIVIAVLGTSLGFPNRPNFRKPLKIVGGEETRPNEFPWQLSLQYFGSHICGASIYNEVTAVTAAHCIVSEEPGVLSVKAGKHHLYEFEADEQTREVSEIKIHVGYPGTTGFSNDIAVLKLSQPLVFHDDVVAPISLAPRGHTATGVATVTGWGAVREGGSLPEKLRKVDIPIISDQACNSVYGADSFQGSNMICTLQPQGGRDSCTGDSGGPMIANDLGPEVGYYLAGITSWGYGCARPGYPGVYCEVSEFVDFIEVNSG